MKSIDRLLDIMARLRDPERGCPWDRQQTYQSIVRHTLEEAYEVADTIERGEFDELKDELGDLLFQVVFYAQIAAEEGLFDFDQVVESISDKLVRRHPHVFETPSDPSVETQSDLWESLKEQERRARFVDPGHFAGIPRGLPSLSRAVKLQARAARKGFDWPDWTGAIAKLDEEIAETRAELTDALSPAAIEHEVGDLLFAGASVARKAGVDPEQALRHANRRFVDRFEQMLERLNAQELDPEQCSLDTLLRVWDETK